MTINEIIIVTTFGVCVACIFAGVWAAIKLRGTMVRFVKETEEIIDEIDRKLAKLTKND